MKKICCVTAARSEYGLLKWIMKDIESEECFQLQLVVTGAHLSASQGNTVSAIEKDFAHISEAVDAGLEDSSAAAIGKSMGRLQEKLAGTLERLQPDYLMVLGDRYELLTICNTAFIMNIPIIHISGGDITQGAIDNSVRNAVTMMADYHFPGTVDSARNIERMRNSGKNIWAVGEPGLDSFFRETVMDRRQIARELKIDPAKRWVLLTFHPETKQTLSYNINTVNNIVEVLLQQTNLQIVATYANADPGGKQINEALESYAKRNTDKIKTIPSLGQKRYLSFMKEAQCVIGNSSSGIVEAPFLGIPVINVGDRQTGRYFCKNIIQSSGDRDDLINAMNQMEAVRGRACADWNYWGDGHTSRRIVDILKEVL